jgi:hypothetical protein
MDKTSFNSAKIKAIELSTKAKITLPIRYFDSSCMQALFSAPAFKVRQLLPSKKLKPLLLSPGKALVSLMAMEYPKVTDIKPYNEFMIGIPVQYEPRINFPGQLLLFHPLIAPKWYRKFGVYIHHLPVTTQESVIVGTEIWGFPKIKADISFEDIGQMHRCRLMIEGKNIVTLEVKKITTKVRSIDLYSYTMKDDQLFYTRMQTQGQYGISKSFGGASYTLGDGSIAEELKNLEIRKTAFGCFYATDLQNMLHATSEHLQL